MQTPPYINHPARVAERIATLDLLSDGRVEFGTGAGATETELGGFNVPQAEKKNMQMEGMRVAVRMLVEDPFTGYDGQFVKVPARNVVPKPLQKPHPPLWMACSRRESIIQAAKLGMGALTFSFVSPEEARQWVKDYYEVIENECEPLGYAVNPNFAVAAPFLCDRDRERVEQIGAESYGFFIYGLGPLQLFRRASSSEDRHLGRVQEPSARVRASRRPHAGLCRHARLCCASVCAISSNAGIDQVLCISQAGQDPARSAVLVHRAVLQGGAAGVQGSRSCKRDEAGRAPRAHQRESHGSQAEGGSA